MRGFLLTPTYRVVNGVPEVHLYGVLESGQPCLIIDDRTRPHFFVRTADADAARALGVAVEPSPLRTLTGEPAATVTVGVPGDVPPLRHRLEERGVVCLEADVRFAYRYLIDRGIRGAFEISGSSQVHGRVGHVFRNPTLQPTHWQPKLKVLSIDIETAGLEGQLYSIALHTRDFSRVLFVGHQMFEHAEPVHSEKAAIRRFLEYVDLLDPDVITGWNVVDFDLAFLARAARRYGIRFTIGRSDDEFNLRKDASFTRESRAVTYGRVVLDALSLLRGAFIRLDDYKLETAAQAFLGTGKLFAGERHHEQISQAYEHDPQLLVNYNLKDAELVSAILDHTGLVDLAVERSLLTGMQLDRVSAAIASVDSLYLAELRQRGVVAPSVGAEEKEARITGGYVMESRPGLYTNVLVFDFKSLYPSIVRSLNLDPLTFVRVPRADGDYIRTPNGAHFRRDIPGILPALVARLASEREQAKRAGQVVKANAIKILMNSMFGVLGSGASRLFFPEVANAITHAGQHLIKFAAEHAAARGYDVIYGDTDSLFIHSNESDPARALALAEVLRADIGAAVATAVREEFGCESYLELEFEKLYHRFFLPEVRGGKVGSKKRYAGLLVENGREKIEFVGLESVRRDWSEVSKRFQGELLQRVFHDQPVAAFIKEFVADLRTGTFDALLSYKKAIRKDLAAYTKTTPAHVKAARKQRGAAGRMVEYVVTRNGPEPVGEETGPPDYAHYIEHQLEPVADAILRCLGTDFATIVQSRKQLALF
ncbi:MAG: DNA polymerase II [Deltaproteobacteria bacterium]|nr:DNA polymerase II [Deltaproteobacteria bacterium]MBI3390526.1 DNA polymerase II [Deltaproteobacteria bacterium]